MQLDNTAVRTMNIRTLATRRAVLAQENNFKFGLRVYDIAALGLKPHNKRDTTNNKAILNRALVTTDTEYLSQP